MKKTIYARYGFTDVIIKADQDVPKYVAVNTAQGFNITESELSLIGFEDEEGVECNEDGSAL